MAKKDAPKSKFEPSGSGWRGRKNKTYQDRIPSGQRERVSDWQDRVQYMQDHHPRKAGDW